LKRISMVLTVTLVMTAMLLAMAVPAATQEKPDGKGANVGHRNFEGDEYKCQATDVEPPSGARHASQTCNNVEPTIPGETTFWSHPEPGPGCDNLLLTNPGDVFVLSGNCPPPQG